MWPEQWWNQAVIAFNRVTRCWPMAPVLEKTATVVLRNISVCRVIG